MVLCENILIGFRRMYQLSQIIYLTAVETRDFIIVPLKIAWVEMKHQVLCSSGKVRNEKFFLHWDSFCRMIYDMICLFLMQKLQIPKQSAVPIRVVAKEHWSSNYWHRSTFRSFTTVNGESLKWKFHHVAVLTKRLNC